jgi:arylformamidase
MSKTLYDITPRVGRDLAVFPGDTPLTREIILDLERGDSVTLSTLRATCHLGAHVDAPSHYDRAGAPIGDRELESFLGRCRVVRVDPGPDSLVTVDMLRAALAGEPGAALPTSVDAERVLISTGTFPDPNTFRTNFAGLARELVEWLAGEGVQLVGIDTPSIDPAKSKALPAHAAVAKHDMNILEGVVLDEVPAGFYELIALPLRLVEFDGSPVRAVLRALAD